MSDGGRLALVLWVLPTLPSHLCLFSSKNCLYFFFFFSGFWTGEWATLFLHQRTPERRLRSTSQNISMDNSVQRTVGASRPPPVLRPPPLFRSIGPPGLPAGVPPHRRLRSMFCRSRAVLPANTHVVGDSDVRTFTDILTGNHAPTIMCPLGCNDALSEDIRRGTMSAALEPAVDSDLQSGAAVFRSGFFADRVSPRAHNVRQDRQLFSHVCPSARVNVRQGSGVTPLQTSEEPAIKERQHQKRRKRSYRVDCTGEGAVPSLTEKEEDTRLCEWLQSLGIAGGKAKASITTNNQQQLFVSRCSGVMSLRHPDTAASQRRDRRPHFLPPICQSDSLLHVPLLLPENSPPPSPCTDPDAPIHYLPIPPLKPISSRRKWEAVGQPVLYWSCFRLMPC